VDELGNSVVKPAGEPSIKNGEGFRIKKALDILYASNLASRKEVVNPRRGTSNALRAKAMAETHLNHFGADEHCRSRPGYL